MSAPVVVAGLLPEERALGQSTSNYNADKAAAELARIFRMQEDLPDVISEEEMIGDNARACFNRYCRFLSSRVIPKNFDENLLPKNPDQKGKLVTATLLGYIGSHLKQVQRSFPSHPNWANGNAPVWWTPMRKDFEKECDNFQKTYSGDAIFGAAKLHPVYRCVNDPPLPPNFTGRIDDFVTVIDLRYILRRLASQSTVGGNNRCLERVLVGMTHYCIGRGGEIKFQNFNDWSWDPKLTCVDPQWHEVKVIDTYPMPLVPDKEYWETDTYHQLGCYFAVEKGLFRTADQIQRGLLNSVFPSLHRLADSYVATKISKIMQRSLPRGCPATLKAGYTTRSCRKGAITELSMHPKMNTLRIAARSGHSTGTTIDSYLDKSNPARCTHASIAAAGWEDVERPIAPYRLEAIANPAETSKLMRKLFPCSVPHFNRSGKLHIVLKTCAAALIMYHPKVDRDLGPSNAISTKVRNAAREAGIKDDRFPNLSPESVLNEWAKLVASDFQLLNNGLSAGTNIATGIETILNMNRQMAADLADIKNSHESLTLENASGKARVSNLEEHVSSLKGLLHHANRKLSIFKSPEGTPQKSPPSRGIASGAGDGEEDEDCVVISPSETGPERQRESVNSRLRYGSTGRQLSEKAKKAGKHTATDNDFGKVLVDLMTEGILRVPFSDTELPKHTHEAHLLRHCFHLSDYIGCFEDKKMLMDGTKDEVDRLQAAQNIEQSLFVKLLEFEGTTLEIEVQNTKKKRKKRTYIAFGGRIINYKGKIRDAGGEYDAKTPYAKVAFVEVSELEKMEREKSAVGTPPGNTSILAHFGKNANARRSKRRRLDMQPIPVTQGVSDEDE